MLYCWMNKCPLNNFEYWKIMNQISLFLCRVPTYYLLSEEMSNWVSRNLLCLHATATHALSFINIYIALIRHSFRFLLWMISLSVSICLSVLCPLSLPLQLILGLLQRSVPLRPRGNLLLELPTGEPSAQWLGSSVPFNTFPIYLTAVGPVQHQWWLILHDRFFF